MWDLFSRSHEIPDLGHSRDFVSSAGSEIQLLSLILYLRRVPKSNLCLTFTFMDAPPHHRYRLPPRTILAIQRSTDYHPPSPFTMIYPPSAVRYLSNAFSFLSPVAAGPPGSGRGVGGGRDPSMALQTPAAARQRTRQRKGKGRSVKMMRRKDSRLCR